MNLLCYCVLLTGGETYERNAESTIPELTSEILHTFIQRVEVGERAERYSRTAPQEIRIYYRDIGIVDDIPETMDISELYEEYPDDVA